MTRCRSNCSPKQIPEAFFTAIHAVQTSLCLISKQLLWLRVTRPASHEVQRTGSAFTKQAIVALRVNSPTIYSLGAKSVFY